MVLLVLIGPLVSPYEVDQTNWSKLAKPPSMQDGHIFGTDDLGRDLFVRTMYGGRISLMVGIVATRQCLDRRKLWCDFGLCWWQGRFDNDANR